VPIFQLSRKIKNYSKELLNLNITCNEARMSPKYSQSETIVIGNNLRIWLNVSNAEGRVWGATLEITGVNEYDKVKKKSETYKILEKIRKNNDLEWEKENLNYFLEKITS